jgi:pimeloyl-[acyl-carrier protein] methyl ester esterase
MTIRTFVLPGLDGSAELRAEFVTALAPEFEATVLAYPNDIPLDYDGLTEWARQRLPTDEAFVLIAESFSGPVAIKLAAARPEGLIGVVLTATFACSPRPALAPLRALVGWLPLLRPPMWPIMLAMMGRWSTREWTHRLRSALVAVAPTVLQRRLASAATVDVTALVAEIECPSSTCGPVATGWCFRPVGRRFARAAVTRCASRSRGRICCFRSNRTNVLLRSSVNAGNRARAR